MVSELRNLQGRVPLTCLLSIRGAFGFHSEYAHLRL